MGVDEFPLSIGLARRHLRSQVGRPAIKTMGFNRFQLRLNSKLTPEIERIKNGGSTSTTSTLMKKTRKMRNSWRKKGEFNSWKWGFKQQIEIQPTTGDKLKSSAVMVQPCTQVSYPQVLVQLSVMFAPPFWSVQFHFCLGLSPKLCWWKDTLFLGTSEIRWYHPPIHSDIFWHKQGSFFKNQLVRGQCGKGIW